MDSSSGPSFNFINLTHPDDLKDGETQTRIRRLAMAEFGKTRRKPKTKRARNEIVLDFRNPSRDLQVQRQLSRSSFDRFRGGNVDPFTPYPIELTDASRELLVNVFRQDSVHLVALRASWFTVALYDPAPFYAVLANSRLSIQIHLHGISASKNDADSLRFFSKALRLVNERLMDPNQHTQDIVIGAIASFLCHDWYIQDFDTLNKHKDAMLRMIELRGGPETIKQEALRITVSWCELVGSHSQDTPPKLPLPPKWDSSSRSPPSAPRQYSFVSLLWKQRFPMRIGWISIFDDITQLISLDRAFTDEQFEASMQTGSWLEPTMVRLLQVRPLEADSSPGSVMEEVCRLGTLLFLAPAWRYMGVKPVWTDVFTKKLLGLLNNHRVEWAELKPLLVWTLYFAAIETADPEERRQFIFNLAMVMKGVPIQEWEGVLHVVKSVVWIEPVFKNSDIAIRDEVMAMLS